MVHLAHPLLRVGEINKMARKKKQICFEICIIELIDNKLPYRLGSRR
jgi:hypothetical protein